MRTGERQTEASKAQVAREQRLSLDEKLDRDLRLLVGATSRQAPACTKQTYAKRCRISLGVADTRLRRLVAHGVAFEDISRGCAIFTPIWKHGVVKAQTVEETAALMDKYPAARQPPSPPTKRPLVIPRKKLSSR
jgi:hypothetical protein